MLPLIQVRRHMVPDFRLPEVRKLPGMQSPHRHPDRLQGKRRQPDPRAITQLHAKWGEGLRNEHIRANDTVNTRAVSAN